MIIHREDYSNYTAKQWQVWQERILEERQTEKLKQNLCHTQNVSRST